MSSFHQKSAHLKETQTFTIKTLPTASLFIYVAKGDLLIPRGNCISVFREKKLEQGKHYVALWVHRKRGLRDGPNSPTMEQSWQESLMQPRTLEWWIYSVVILLNQPDNIFEWFTRTPLVLKKPQPKAFFGGLSSKNWDLYSTASSLPVRHDSSARRC